MTQKKEIEEDLKRRKDLTCLWIGRINRVKMDITGPTVPSQGPTVPSECTTAAPKCPTFPSQCPTIPSQCPTVT